MQKEKKIRPATNPQAHLQGFAAQKHTGYITPCPEEPIYFLVKATKTTPPYWLKITKEQIPAVLYRFGSELIIAPYYRVKYAEWFEKEYIPKPSKKSIAEKEIIP